MDSRRNARGEAQEVLKTSLVVKGSTAGEHVSGLSRPQKATLAVNIGLFLSIVLSVIALLPLQWPLIERWQLRLFSGIAVMVFLDLSFWLAGWFGSALGITLLGLVLAFMMAIGQHLGLVGAVLSGLGGLASLLLMLSDLHFLKDGEWVSPGRLMLYLGLFANLAMAALGFVLWLTFGTR